MLANGSRDISYHSRSFLMPLSLEPLLVAAGSFEIRLLLGAAVEEASVSVVSCLPYATTYVRIA